jgi:hypothetical protein
MTRQLVRGSLRVVRVVTILTILTIFPEFTSEFPIFAELGNRGGFSYARQTM